MQNCFSIKSSKYIIWNKLSIIKRNTTYGFSENNGWTYQAKSRTTHQFQLDTEFGQLKCLFYGGVCGCHILIDNNQIGKQTDRQTHVWTIRTDLEKKKKNMRCDWPFYMLMLCVCACGILEGSSLKRIAQCRNVGGASRACETHPLNRLLIYTFLRTSHSDNRFAGLIHINCIYEPNSTASIFSFISSFPVNTSHFYSSSLPFNACLPFSLTIVHHHPRRQQHNTTQMVPNDANKIIHIHGRSTFWYHMIQQDTTRLTHTMPQYAWLVFLLNHKNYALSALFKGFTLRASLRSIWHCVQPFA